MNIIWYKHFLLGHPLLCFVVYKKHHPHNIILLVGNSNNEIFSYIIGSFFNLGHKNQFFRTCIFFVPAPANGAVFSNTHDR
ncbi:ORF1204 [White spot syndrome virus]|uniref:ORF1204 n=1 Tax=White spot syndrome virus TaxID=342409 RepID=A0A2D3I614_9VIRU|nr:ORF1204 [White spot syndrome virus]